ncbi:MAG: hypothetical protein ABIK09_18130 [Pseudomonadota bacterium]
MLKRTLLFVALLTLIPTLAFAESVTATIDGSCALKSATITVPAGKTASGFSLGALAAGTKCTVGGAPDTKGWGITSGGVKVYYWSSFKGGSPSEVGGALSGLVLQPGTYGVFVDGGAGASATVNFTIK